MIFSGSLTEKKEKISNHGRKILGELSDMMLTKYLLLLCILAVMAVSVGMIENMMSVESTMIYTAGNDILGLRPCNFYGIFAPFVSRFSDWAMIFDLMYVVFVVLISAVIFGFLKKTDDKLLKACVLLGCCTVIYAVSNMSGYTVFSLEVSLIPVIAAYFTYFTDRYFLAPVFAALAVLIDPCVIVIILPVSVVAYFIFRSFRDRNEYKRAAMTAGAVVLSSVIVMLVSQAIIANGGETHGELLESRFPAEFFDCTDIANEINAIAGDGRYITSTPISAAAGCLEIKTGFIGEIGYLGGPFLMIFVYVLVSLFSRMGDVRKEAERKKLLVSSAVFSLFMFCLAGKMICGIAFLTLLYLMMLMYHRKNGEKMNIAEKDFVCGCIAGAVVMRLLQLIICEHPEHFSLTHYYLDYETFGFMPRLLIGSIFVKLSGGVFTADTAVAVMTVFEMITVIAGAWIFFGIYKKSSDRKERYVLMMLMFILAFSPASSSLTNYTNLQKLDWFLTALSLVCIWALYKNNKMVFIIPVMCILSMLIHHVFVCTLFPLLFIMMVYRAMIRPDGHGVRNTAVMMISLGITAVMFFWFNFMYEPPANISVEYMSSVVETRSAGTVEPVEDLIQYVFLGHSADRVEYTVNTYLLNDTHRQIVAVIVFLLSLPLTILYVYALYSSVKKETTIIKKLAYAAIGLSLLVTLAPLFTDCDWGRWISNYLMTIIAALVFVTALQPADKKWYNGGDNNNLRVFLYVTLLLQSVMPSLHTTLSDFPLFKAW